MEVRMRDGGERQGRLFDDKRQYQVPQLKEEVQQEVCRLLVAWMRALAEKMTKEGGNE
jgi:hypothetical protein